MLLKLIAPALLAAMPVVAQIPRIGKAIWIFTIRPAQGAIYQAGIQIEQTSETDFQGLMLGLGAPSPLAFRGQISAASAPAPNLTLLWDKKLLQYGGPRPDLGPSELTKVPGLAEEMPYWGRLADDGCYAYGEYGKSRSEVSGKWTAVVGTAGRVPPCGFDLNPTPQPSTPSATGCTVSSLTGAYVYNLTGRRDPSAEYRSVGRITFDGLGRAEGSETASLNGAIARSRKFTATYDLFSDCTGWIALATEPAILLDVVATADRKALELIQADEGASITGKAAQQ